MTSPEVIFTICRRTKASPYYILKSLIFGWNALRCPLPWPCRVIVPRSANQTKTSWPSFCCWSWTSPQPATYEFRLLVGNRSVGIKTTTQFFHGPLDLSRRILLLQKGHPLRLRLRLSSLRFVLFAVLVNKWLSLRCKDFSGFFELIVLEYVKRIFPFT